MDEKRNTLYVNMLFGNRCQRRLVKVDLNSRTHSRLNIKMWSSRTILLPSKDILYVFFGEFGCEPFALDLETDKKTKRPIPNIEESFGTPMYLSESDDLFYLNDQKLHHVPCFSEDVDCKARRELHGFNKTDSFAIKKDIEEGCFTGLRVTHSGSIEKFQICGAQVTSDASWCMHYTMNLRVAVDNRSNRFVVFSYEPPNLLLWDEYGDLITSIKCDMAKEADVQLIFPSQGAYFYALMSVVRARKISYHVLRFLDRRFL